MITINYRGRISNNFIQFLVGAFLSHRYNLEMRANFPINSEGIKYKEVKGGMVGSNRILVHDNNWLEIIENNLPYTDPHFHLDGYFNSILFFEKYEKEIKSFLILNYDEQISKNSVMINYRLGDIEGTRMVLPLEYYIEALDSIEYDMGYITSDSINHKFCKELIKKYDLKPINLDPSETINFSKNFNKLILSEGGFSWSIGFLSNTNNIICSGRHSYGRQSIWHGDIYFERWNKLYWDYDPEIIYDRIQLKKYQPLRLTKDQYMCYNSDGTVYIKNNEKC